MIEDCVPQSCAPVSQFTSEGSVEFFTVTLEQPDATDYVLGYDTPIGGRLSQLRVTAAVGYGRVSVLINGVVVTGLDHVYVAANARNEYNAEDLNIFSPGDDIVLRIESGSSNLLGLKATVVVSNRSTSRHVDVCDMPGKMIVGVMPIVGPLVGAGQISVVITPALKRKPFHIFRAYMEKGGPDEDDIFEVGVGSITTSGWDIFLNGPAVLNQILHYAYIT
jgi:hypothetical protein